MQKIVVTNHAQKRAKRVLPNKKAALEIAQEAFESARNLYTPLLYPNASYSIQKLN